MPLSSTYAVGATETRRDLRARVRAMSYPGGSVRRFELGYVLVAGL